MEWTTSKSNSDLRQTHRVLLEQHLEAVVTWFTTSHGKLRINFRGFWSDEKAPEVSAPWCISLSLEEFASHAPLPPVLRHQTWCQTTGTSRFLIPEWIYENRWVFVTTHLVVNLFWGSASCSKKATLFKPHYTNYTCFALLSTLNILESLSQLHISNHLQRLTFQGKFLLRYWCSNLLALMALYRSSLSF